jgi:hypothetical protein
MSMVDSKKVQCEKRVRKSPHSWQCRNFFLVPKDAEGPFRCNVHRHKKGYPA